MANKAITEPTTVYSIGFEADDIIPLESLAINLIDPTAPFKGGKITYTSKFQFATRVAARYDIINLG